MITFYAYRDENSVETKNFKNIYGLPHHQVQYSSLIKPSFNIVTIIKVSYLESISSDEKF